MSRHRMRPGDAAWLHMDRPNNQMIVTSVMWFDEQLNWDAVRELLEHRLIARYPRFSQRVIEFPGLCWWEDVESFALEEHLHHGRLPAPGSQRDLQRFVSGLIHRSLPSNRPLWELHMLDGYRGEGSAIVLRIHHCIADGMALARVMLSLTDDVEDAAHADVDDNVEHPSVVSTLVHAGESLVHTAVHPARIVDLMGQGVAGARALAKVLTLTPDNHTSLHGSVELRKSVLWSEPVSLSAVRNAAHRNGVTVNDVVLSAVGGGLRAYLAKEDGAARDVRAILPVNLRPLDEPLPVDLGNRFGLAYLDLPVSIDDPDERLAEVRRRTVSIKHSPEGAVTFGVLDLVGRTPERIEQLFVGMFASKGSVIITNVPGPRRPVELAGRQVRGTIAWPPTSGNIGMGVSVVSYNGAVILGLMCDDHRVPEPEIVLSCAVRELERLVSSVGDWVGG